MNEKFEQGKRSKPPILLTGGAGYIGSHVAVELLAKNDTNIVIYDNLSNSTQDAIETIRKITDRPVAFVYGDVRSVAQGREVLKRYRPDAVVHLAGMKSVSGSFSNPLEYWDVNVGGTLTLMKCMEGFGRVAIYTELY